MDIAPLLESGKNTLAAVVWNGGEYKPMAQISAKTGFIVQGDGVAEQIVNTDHTWRVCENKAFHPLVYLDNDRRIQWQYYVAGVLDSVTAADYPWGWENLDYDDSDWIGSRQIDRPKAGFDNYHQKWTMTPRVVPLLQLEYKRVTRIARTEPDINTDGFIEQQKPVYISAHSQVIILFDNTHLGHGYPELTVSGGKGSFINIRYAEAFFREDRSKGHRDSLQDKLISVHDVFVPDGGGKRQFRPLWTRTFRWLQLEVETGDTPLIIDDLWYESSQYPTNITAEFNSSGPMLGKLWDACIRTQKLSAQETFVSDMYWEQIQYIGDTKVQTLSYLFLTGDETLFRLALKQFDESRQPNGLTQSRYPCNLVQYTATYALTWSTSPAFEFLSTLCGIESMGPGFSSIEIKPAFNGLDYVKGKMLHPKGEIVVDLERGHGKIKGYVSTPQGVPAVFVWQQSRTLLQGGEQKIDLAVE